MKSGIKTVESELHALVHCPLYDSVKNRSAIFANFGTPSDCQNLFSNPNGNPNNLMLVGEIVHNILDINCSYTTYYYSQDFHNNTGDCVML